MAQQYGTNPAPHGGAPAMPGRPMGQGYGTMATNLGQDAVDHPRHTAARSGAAARPAELHAAGTERNSSRLPYDPKPVTGVSRVSFAQQYGLELHPRGTVSHDLVERHQRLRPRALGTGQVKRVAGADTALGLEGQERGPALFFEVRGLGLLCVADLFGREAILDECEVAFIVRLAEYTPGTHFERIGLERRMEMLLGIEIPTVTLPVHAGSNLATLVDLAIRDWQLRLRGVNAARRLDDRLRAFGTAESGPGGFTEGGIA